ncbi:MAG TPA: BamA/TamA family outer membrane protein [Kofleriaceae bacterium]
MAFPVRLRGRTTGIAFVMLAALAQRASAQSEEPTESSSQPEQPTRLTAQSEEPPPGAESGRVDEIDESPSTLRLVGRSLLFVPRTIVDVVALPIRGGLWLSDRYRLVDRYNQIFFNDAMTVGLYPTIQRESGFGVNVGARFVARDVFGAREHVSVRAATGGRFRERASAQLDTGDRLGEHVSVGVVGEADRRAKEAFYGFGNDGLALEGRHRQELRRARAAVDVRVFEDLHARAAGALTQIDYEPSDPADGMPIDLVYDTSMLVGWDGVRHTYGELEVRWDSRRAASQWDPPGLVSAGWLAAVYTGRVHQLDALRDYWRYGADLQHFLWLGLGPRVLVTRLHGEAVSAGDVAFTELPQLGGATWLRGYPFDRFRDRVAVLGSAEYQWDLIRHASASLFVDVGRVYGSLGDVGFDELRVGYGVGLQVQTTRSFVAEASLASSKDGGLFLNITFDPVYRISPREARR